MISLFVSAAYAVQSPRVDAEVIKLGGVLLFFAVALLLLGIGALRQRSKRICGGPPILQKGKVVTYFFRPTDLIVVAVIIGWFMLNAVAGALVDEKELELNFFSLGFSIFAQFFMAGLCMAFVLSRVSAGRWLGLSWANFGWALLIAPAVIFVANILVAGIQLTGFFQFLQDLEVGDMQAPVRLLTEEKDMVLVWLMVFTAVIVAPICEEIVFRGFMHGVAKKFAGVGFGSVAVAFLFSAIHGNIFALLPLLILALLLALVYEWTGSIWAPIAAHMAFNALTVGLQMLARFGYIELPQV